MGIPPFWLSFLDRLARRCQGDGGRVLQQRDQGACSHRTGGAFDLERISVVLVEALERFDEQEVNADPNGTTPVRVTTEHGTVRITGPVTDTKVFTANVDVEGVLLVVFAERTNTVRREELVLVKHTFEDQLETLTADH